MGCRTPGVDMNRRQFLKILPAAPMAFLAVSTGKEPLLKKVEAASSGHLADHNYIHEVINRLVDEMPWLR